MKWSVIAAKVVGKLRRSDCKPGLKLKRWYPGKVASR